MSHNFLVINVKWAIKIHASSLRNDDIFFSTLSLVWNPKSTQEIK